MQLDLGRPDARPSSTAGFRAQVCIVGAGIAGLVLAHRLASAGVHVLLAEAGGTLPEPGLPTELCGDPYAAATHDRIRALGGTSLLWGGQLLPAPVPSPWGLPDDLSPFTSAAVRLLGADDLPFTAADFFPAVRRPAPALLASLPGYDARLSKFLPFARRNLASTLGSTFRSSPHVQLLLHAPVTALHLNPAGDRIRHAHIRTPAGDTLPLYADHFVLAAGTLESVRLLLASRSVLPGGIGNRHGRLGLGFHDHLTLPLATAAGPSRDALLRQLRPWIFHGTLHSLKLEPNPGLRARLGVPPAMLHLTVEEPPESGVGLVRRALRARQGTRHRPPLGELLRHLAPAAFDSTHLALSARLQHRRFVSSRASVRLQLNLAQTPPTRSRISLSDRSGPDGLPLPAVAFHVAPADLAAVRTLAAFLRDQLAPALPPGLGWLPALTAPEPTALLPYLDDARHLMGGAPLGSDPLTSIVDPNLSVHGIPNLFLASAAVFPDGSPQLPSLTLVALTLRLAAHLISHFTP